MLTWATGLSCRGSALSLPAGGADVYLKAVVRASIMDMNLRGDAEQTLDTESRKVLLGVASAHSLSVADLDALIDEACRERVSLRG